MKRVANATETATEAATEAATEGDGGRSEDATSAGVPSAAGESRAAKRRRKNREKRQLSKANLKIALSSKKDDTEQEEQEREEAGAMEREAEMSAAEKLLQEAMQTIGGRDGTLSDWLNPAHRHYWKELKRLWKKVPKRKRQALIDSDKASCDKMRVAITHAFPTESDDHCETAPEAYKDIAGLLEALATQLGKAKADLRIYDPYYCSGAVVRHLGDLGFTNVYNRNEDFYQVEKHPEHDVVVTNPPYSSDHVARLLKFVEKNAKPTLMLMPNYVSTKSYLPSGITFVAPFRRYMYWTPKGLRTKDKTQNHVSTLGVRTSPFVSLWYLYGVDTPLAEAAFAGSDTCRFAETTEGLPRGVISAKE